MRSCRAPILLVSQIFLVTHARVRPAPARPPRRAARVAPRPRAYDRGAAPGVGLCPRSRIRRVPISPAPVALCSLPFAYGELFFELPGCRWAPGRRAVAGLKALYGWYVGCPSRPSRHLSARSHFLFSVGVDGKPLGIGFLPRHTFGKNICARWQAQLAWRVKPFHVCVSSMNGMANGMCSCLANSEAEPFSFSMVVGIVEMQFINYN